MTRRGDDGEGMMIIMIEGDDEEINGHFLSRKQH